MSLNSAFRRILAVNSTGSVKNLLSKLDPKISLNEGACNYQIKADQSPTSKPYYGKTTDIHIPLTNTNVDVTEWDKSFFTLDFHVTLTFPHGLPFLEQGAAPPPWAANVPVDWTNPLWIAIAKATFIFFGYKAATDCIYMYRVVVNGVDVAGTTVQQAQIPSFLMNNGRPKSEWENKSGSMSLWEDVHNHDTSACGKYVSYYES
jgi:hypothetical protein